MTWLYVPELSTDSPYVPGLVGSNLDSDWLSETATVVCVSSKGTPTPRPLSWRGWRMRPWNRRLSGTTFDPSTAALGVESWISSLRASRVSRGALPASNGELRTSAGSGRTSHASFARWDRSSCSWRTYPSLLGEGWDTFSGIWPKRGSLVSGICFRLPKSERRICAGGSSSWPPPMALYMTGTNRSVSPNAAVRPGLELIARYWTTPMAHDATDGYAHRVGRFG